MRRNDLVYDVGMNNGDDTAYYLSLGFRVIAIEANPELVAKAKFRFLREIMAGRLIILNVGIAQTEGQLPFWICERDSCFSSFHRDCASWENAPVHEVTVPTLQFETILEKYGVPHFCKIDIQGNELLCLQAFKPHDVPTFLSVEAWGPQVLDILYALGYSQFKCISQWTFLPLQLSGTPEQRKVERANWLLQSPSLRHRVLRKVGGRKRLLDQLEQLRTHKGWTFPPLSSGPFGDQTLGRWLSYGEMKQTYEEFLRRKDIGQKSIFWDYQRPHLFWADFHAHYVEARNSLTSTRAA